MVKKFISIFFIFRVKICPVTLLEFDEPVAYTFRTNAQNVKNVAIVPGLPYLTEHYIHCAYYNTGFK